MGANEKAAAAYHGPQLEGVWALVDRDHSESITEVYPNELEALRALNGRGYGRVLFVPWGTSLENI